ncbi:MAG: hypothetical protein M3217_08100 [Actinomycetota bacterium]|nr:hypothetical protein [Actinomycetota bacterium]
MSVTEWAVVAGGLAAIAWVNWYFFLAEGAGSRGQPSSDGRRDRGAQDGNDRG